MFAGSPGQSRPCSVCRWRQNATETVSPRVATHVTRHDMVGKGPDKYRKTGAGFADGAYGSAKHSQAIAGFWNHSDGI